jgi:hypothetical protein
MPDWLIAGNPGWDGPGMTEDIGKVVVLEVPQMPGGDAFIPRKGLIGTTAGERLGTSVSTLAEIGAPIAGDAGEVVVGAPGRPVGGVDGAVLVVDRSGFSGGGAPEEIDASDPFLLLTIPAKDAVTTGTDAEADFGSLVVGLPDLGNFDPTGDDWDASAYVYVANTNMAHGSSSATPEYFIFAVRWAAGPGGEYKLVKHVKGTAGTMLGGQARLLPDINGDGVADLAIAHAGGQGQLGLTGNVQILSGKGLTTPTADDDLLQVLYNPDPTGSNFGVSIEYSDMTGDGLPDFIVGANEYDSSAYQDAGAVYVFTMAPVK